MVPQNYKNITYLMCFYYKKVLYFILLGVIHKPRGHFGYFWPPPPSWSLLLNKAYVICSERPEWNFTETGPKPKYGFFTELTGTETQYRNNTQCNYQPLPSKMELYMAYMVFTIFPVHRACTYAPLRAFVD